MSHTVRKPRRKPHRAATQAERDTLRFKAIETNFNWTDQEWARAWLPGVRLAARLLADDDVALKASIVRLGGAVPTLLNELCETKEHLLALAEMVGIALSRTFVTLERLGYSPENPPPDDIAHMVPGTERVQ
jgi:hypothetical protein